GRHVDELEYPTVVQITLRDINGKEHGSELCELSAGGDSSDAIVVETENGQLTFEKHDEEVWLTNYSGTDVSLEIPSEVEGLPVTRIDNNAISGYELRDLVIPEGIKSIGCRAISYVSSMTELTLPSTLEDIGRAPIGSADKLERIELRGESSAVSVKDGVLFSADGKTLIKYPKKRGVWYSVPQGTEKIDFEAFYEVDLYEIEFPETLRNIDNYAFEGCLMLDSLVLPDSLTRIGAGAFSEGFTFFNDEEADIIEKVKIGANVKSIGQEAFSGYPIESFEVSEDNTVYSAVNGMITSKAGDVLVLCPAEIGGSVIVPDAVVGLTAGVFNKLPFDTAFYFPDSLVRMNMDDFPEKEGDSTDSGYEITIYCSEGSAAETFAAKNKLNYVTVDPGDLNLKTYTNQQVPGLNGVYKFRVYDDHAVFTSYTGSDNSISIPDVVRGVPVTEIGDGEKSVYEHKNRSFSAYWGYEDNTVETSNLGMYSEDYLQNVDIPVTVVCINDGAFSDSSIHIDEFVLPDHLEKLGPNAFGGRYSSMSVGRFTISEDNENYKTVGGVLFSKDGKTLLRFPTKADTGLEAVSVLKEGRTSRYEYQIPEGCEVVGRYAFANAKLIKKESTFESSVDDFSVQFSPDVVLVDEYAFNDSEIGRVYLNEGLETIADRAFYGSKLKDDVLTLPSTVTSLGDEAFASIYREVAGFSHIELPEDLKKLGESVFSSYRTDLVCDELVIGRKLTNIAEGAFKGLRTSGFAVDPDNSKFSSENGCLLDAEGETLITVPQGIRGEVKVPDSVKRIEKYAFYDCAGMTDVYIGPEVTSIHPQAIYQSDKEQKIVIHGPAGSEA
ncbi:MAG: leucine-rich repeat protein, partial [Lachnospiraceae bacterium]|nr:leucine-rich repeat protein [Lachnospiraceae bacterium]